MTPSGSSPLLTGATGFVGRAALYLVHGIAEGTDNVRCEATAAEAFARACAQAGVVRIVYLGGVAPRTLA